MDGGMLSLPERAQTERPLIEAELRRRDLTPRLRERLEMVKAVALGQNIATIAAWSGRSPGRIRHWLDRFLQDGTGGLSDAPRSGRPPKADAAYGAALETALVASPRELGLLFDAWNSPRLSAYLAEQTGVSIAPGWLRALLAGRHYACGRPKHTLKHLQDETAIAAFTTELAVVGGKGSRDASADGAALPG